MIELGVEIAIDLAVAGENAAPPGAMVASSIKIDVLELRPGEAEIGQFMLEAS